MTGLNTVVSGAKRHWLLLVIVLFVWLYLKNRA